ncbi:MAG: hypothetical protein AB1451_01525 [Nitrospirota bacterium]
MTTRFLRWWARSVFQVKIWWLASAGNRLERRIEERKRRPLRSL